MDKELKEFDWGGLNWQHLLGISGESAADALLLITAPMTPDTEVFIRTVKTLIDSMFLSMTQAFGAGQAVSIMYDILDDEGVFGMVGKAYLRAPNVCRVTLVYDPDEDNYRPVGMTVEAVAGIIGRRRKNGRIVEEDVREINTPSDQTIIDLMKTLI